MFYQLSWKIKHYLYLRKWVDSDTNYQNQEQFNDLNKLINSLGEGIISDEYQEQRFISTAYETLPDWLAACESARKAIHEDRLKPQPNLIFKSVKLADFLISDGYEITYLSGLRSVNKALTDLYDIIEKLPSKSGKDYIYRQLKELFISGLNFYKTPIVER